MTTPPTTDPDESRILNKTDVKPDRSSWGDARSSSPPRKANAVTMKPARRLGMRELGWYAHERAMPNRILKRIEASIGVQVSNIVPVLAGLCERDDSVKTAYLCHPSVQYITKTRGEGSFCGYRNIQMLLSYIVGSKAPGHEIFLNGVPSILQVQDLIEEAWNRGINSEGLVETGGIRGTRKHIGTPEAQALFKSLDFTCRVGSFRTTSKKSKAWDQLLAFAVEHFTGASDTASEMKIHRTNVPPIYLQRRRHSMTIIGYETRADGQRNLLVLDPALRPSPRMVRASQAVEEGSVYAKRISLRPYRRGKRRLGAYREFETLSLSLSSPTAI